VSFNAGAFGIGATACSTTVAKFGDVPMARLFDVRLVGAMLLCSFVFLLASFEPFLRAAPIGPSADDQTQAVSINHFRKGDRLPLYHPNAVQPEFRRPDGLQTQRNVPFGCDPAFSPVATPSLSKVFGRCMS
jgi:hypothetical protein